jgi:hypothetical protein
MTVLLKNNAFGFLATAISATDTTITLQAGNGASFPAVGSSEYFYATIQPTAGVSEIVKVIGRAIDVLTVIRAQEGTSAISFTAGSRIELRVTAQSIIDAINSRTEDQINNFSGNGSTTIFTLSSTPISKNYTSVYINGVYQNKNTYSLSGAVLSFSQAPPNMAVVEVSF